MARLARIVAPGCPHHVTARGNRREPIFFEDGDQDIYRDLLAEQLDKAGALARRRRDASRRRAPRTSPICFDGMHWGMVVLSLGYGAPVPLFRPLIPLKQDGPTSITRCHRNSTLCLSAFA